MDLDATGFLSPLLQILWIDLLLSGDNAVVIALACRSLPPDQRRWGIVLGAGAAVLLRIVFAYFIVEMLELPYVKILGGLLLFWIAVRLGEDDEVGHEHIKPAKTIWASVRIIVIADAIMSLDNVVAIAAVAKGSLLLIAFGLALTIPLIVYSSTLMIALLERFSIIVWASAALLGWIAAALVCAEPVLAARLKELGPGVDTWCAPAGAGLVLALAWMRRRFRAA